MNHRYDFTPVTRQQWTTLNNEQVNKLLGLPATSRAVVAYRQTHSLPRGPRKPGSGGQAVYDKSKFRFDKTNAWNARKLGCTRQRAGQMRKELEHEQLEDWC